MATIYELRTFADVVAAVREEIGVASTDTTLINRIKRDINLVYQDVTAEKNWWWLDGTTTVQAQAYINAGTVSVTAGSAAVTFSTAPSMSQKGKFFSTEGFNEIYVVESHTAGATTAKLSDLYAGATSATATYKLWTDRVALPVDCKETKEIWHDYQSIALEGRGKQDFRKIALTAPRAEGKPQYYYTGDFVDPSPLSSITSLPATLTRSSAGIIKTIVFASGLPSAVSTAFSAGNPLRWNISGAGAPSYNGDIIVSSISTTTSTNDTITYTGRSETQESSTSDTTIVVKNIDAEADYDRYRELYLYPCLSTSRITLHVDYIKEVFPLENDSDEPVIPKQDRAILVYGALHRACSRLGKENDATRNYGLYQAKLAKMAGKMQDTIETPRLQPSKIYLSRKRSSVNRMGFSDTNMSSGGVSGGAQVITGTASRAAQYNSSGELEASSTVSTTELGYLDGVTSAIQTQLDAITTLANGTIYMGNASNVATEVTPSGDVTMSNAGVNAIAAGVIVDADINSSAAITRSKTASGTAYRILANTSAGVMSENAALTAAQVVISDANGQLTTLGALPGALNSATLDDNTASATNVATWTAATYDSVIIRYSLKRGSANKASGTLNICTDGTNASIAQTQSDIGTLGVTFTVDVSAGSLRLRYTTTSTGTAATMKYIEEKWLA